MKNIINRKPVRRFRETFRVPIEHVRYFLQKNTEDNISALSGQSAFFVILSIVPFAVFLFFLLTWILGEPRFDIAEKEIAAAGSSTVGSYAANIMDFLKNAYNSRTQALPVAIIIALWSSGKGMYIITDGISRIYRLPAKHNWALRRVFAMGYTFVLVLMLTLTAGILTLNAVIESYITSATQQIPMSAVVIYGFRYVITTVIMALFLTVVLKLYLRRKVEDKKYAKFRVLLPGMAFTAVAWSVLTWGVEFYTKHFTSSMYGSLGTVIIVMMWVYFMMYLLLWGVQINCIYRESFYRFSLRKILWKIRRK